MVVVVKIGDQIYIREIISYYSGDQIFIWGIIPNIQEIKILSNKRL